MTDKSTVRQAPFDLTRTWEGRASSRPQPVTRTPQERRQQQEEQPGAQPVQNHVVEVHPARRPAEEAHVQRVAAPRERHPLPVDGLFVAVGQVPSSSLFDVEKDENGYIITDERTLKTNIEGVFAAGDIRQKDLRQIVTATSDGAIASNQVFIYLSNL